MQILCEIEDNGDIKIASYCLRTDSSLDYLAFKEEAKQALAKSDIKAYARFLRAALICLFSHAEGVVNEIYQKHKIPAVFNGNRFCDRTRNIAAEASKRGKVPSVNFRLEKHLRDLIAHPGIEIAFQSPEGQKETLDYGATYQRLDLKALESLEAQMSPWIDAVCSAFGVSRVEDTDKAISDFVQELRKAGYKELIQERP